MFDPYEKWLKIPNEDRPVTYYELLDIDDDEDDPDVIADAAKRQKSRVLAHQDGPYGDEVDKLIKEINQAKATLSDASRRRDYNRRTFNGKKNGRSDDGDDRRDSRRGSSRGQKKETPVWLWAVMGVAGLLVVGGIVLAVVFTKTPKKEEPSKQEVAKVEEKKPEPVKAPVETPKPAPAPQKPVEQPKPAAPAVNPPTTAPPPPPPPPPPPAKFVKLPVPDSVAQKKAEETIKRQYKADYAKEKPDDKLALAAKFVQPGRENRKDAAEWFVMLREARDLAIQAGRPRLAVETITEIDKWFIIDPHAMKLQALTVINDSIKEDAKEPLKEMAARVIVPLALIQARHAVDDDKFEIALKFIALADSSAHKPKQKSADKEMKEEKPADKPDAKPVEKPKGDEPPENMAKEKTKDELIAKVEACKKEVEAQQKSYQEFVQAQTTLKTAPDDSAANQIVGLYLCFFHGKWDEGLPHLAKAKDAALKNAAGKDLKKPTKFKELLDLGDDWWALSKKEEARKEANVAMHALALFEKAEATAPAQDKNKAADRVKEARKKGPTHLARLLPGSFYGRASAEDRILLLRDGGGTMRSEQAVADGLEWLAQHQFSGKKDRGLWAMDAFNQAGKCNCTDPGEKHDIAGTALGLMPFLGAGETHRSGRYKAVVEQGLRYLISKQNLKEGKFHDNNYENALATLVMCEAYGLTGDKQVGIHAEMAVNYICSVQNADGSWGYTPKAPGDMSITGWQFSALKTAVYAGIRVRSGTLARVSYFLDKVAEPSGLGYGYNAPSAAPASSASGLLCRMYLGTGADDAKLIKGVENLVQYGNFPTRENSHLYMTAYATQVFHHFGHKPWDTWNSKVRDFLIDLQDKGAIAGLEHQKGSWPPSPSEYEKQGGRLLYTTLALITLETYYYHVPIQNYGEALWAD